MADLTLHGDRLSAFHCAAAEIAREGGGAWIILCRELDGCRERKATCERCQRIFVFPEHTA